MIVAFVGDNSYMESKEDKQKILTYLEEKVGDEPAKFYLGGYNSFSVLAQQCCLEYKKKHPRVSLVLVVPYVKGCDRLKLMRALGIYYDKVYSFHGGHT